MKGFNVLRRALTLVLCLTVAMVFLPTVQTKAQEAPKEWLTFSELVLEKGFVNGAQQPYFVRSSIGNDWGKAYMDGYQKTNYDPEMFKEVFHNCKAMGFDAIKIWLNYNHAGMIFDSEMHVIGIDATYLENLPKVIKMAEEAGLYLCFSTFNHCEGSLTTDTSSFKYEQVTQYLHDETAREMVFENWLKPVIEVIKEFDSVVLLDLYTEPEADGGKWNLPNGTNWQEMRGFIKAQREFIEKIDTDVEFYCSATGDTYDIYENYKDLELDYYGYDHYTSAADTHETKDLYLDAPLIYGEVGIKEGTQAKGETFKQTWASNYLKNAELNGIKAGFLWSYGWGQSGNMSITDDKSRPCASSTTYHFWQIDRDYELAGETPILDKPSMAYTTDKNIVFFGSRDAEKYRIERTSDSINWTAVLEFDPLTSPQYEYQPFLFDVNDTTAVAGVTYRYRAVAIDPDGNEAVSEPSNEYKALEITCSEDKNLIKNYSFEDENGFNSTGRNGKWNLYFQQTSNPELQALIQGEYLKNAVPGVDSLTGTHSIYKLARLRQYVELKPNTDYTFTFNYRFTNKQGYWACFAGLSVGAGNDFNYEIFDKKYCQLIDYIQMEDTTKNGEWHSITVFFNSGNIESCWVEFSGYRTKDSNDEWYIDDVYLFETVK